MLPEEWTIRPVNKAVKRIEQRIEKDKSLAKMIKHSMYAVDVRRITALSIFPPWDRYLQ